MKKELDEKKIVELYNIGLSCTKIASIFNVCHATISKRLKKNGVDVIIQPNKMDLNKDIIIEMFNNGYLVTEIAEYFNTSRKPVRRILKENNINVTAYNTKYYHDETFFKVIDTETKAYWLGFLYADGNVVFDKSKYVLSLALSVKDKSHVEKFKKSLKSTSVITERETKCNHKFFKSCRLQINNKAIVKDLVDLGCVPNKSLILTFPNTSQVPIHLLKHFIRGYFEGDGSVYWNKHSNTICFNVLGTYAFLEKLKTHLVENIDNYTDTSIYKKAKGESWFILKGGIQAILALDYLYKDATIFLDRKYKKYIELKQNFYCRSK